MNSNDFYHGLGDCYRSQNMKRIENYLTTTMKKLEADPDSDPALLCMVYNEVGSFYRGTSRYKESYEGFHKSQEIILRVQGRVSAAYATSINNMAGTYRLDKNYEKAISLYKEAMSIFEELGDRESYHYASVHNNIAQAYQACGEYELSLKHLEIALPLIEKMPKHAHEVAVTYINLGTLYYKVGKFDKANECVEKTFPIFDSLDEKKIIHYAAALNLKGHLLFEEKKYQQALEFYEKSADYTKRFFGENVEYKSACKNIERAKEMMKTEK